MKIKEKSRYFYVKTMLKSLFIFSIGDYIFWILYTYSSINTIHKKFQALNVGDKFFLETFFSSIFPYCLAHLLFFFFFFCV